VYHLQVSTTSSIGSPKTNSYSRVRRVKCDEDKPACRRCTNTGRKCDGYNNSHTAITSKNIIKIYIPPIQNRFGSSIGSQGLEFYHQKVASKLFGDFDSDFWSSLVLQLSQSEPAIRHAVAALSAVYKEIEMANSSSPTGSIPPCHLALQESAAAMRCLSAQLEAEYPSNLIPLVACLLFTCLEFMRGSVDVAMVHMRSGFRILNASRSLHSAANSQYIRDRNPENMVIENHIAPVFSRLNVLCILFGHVLAPVQSIMRNNHHPFSTIAEARLRLFEVMDPSLRFIRIASSRVHEDRLTLDGYAEKAKLEYELQQWRSYLEDLVSRLIRSNQPVNHDAVNLLRIHHRVVSIWLSVCASVEECDVDAHTHDFEEIVELGKKLTARLNEQDENLQPERFSFDMQIIPPLYYTAIKCRNSLIRRQAVDILRRATRREGLWNAHIATKVAEKIIEIEERNLLTTHAVHIGMNYLQLQTTPSETDRIHFVQELPGEFKHIDDHTYGDTSLPDHIEVTFRTRPGGLAGDWHSFKEVVNL
jgi:Fungal Zn(2)-Cys(6) binuclear cluster domain